MSAFNPATAAPVTPWRHSPTGKTVGYHQPTGDTTVDVFSIGRLFIANITAEQAESHDFPAPTVIASLPAAAGIFRPAFIELTGGEASLDTLNVSADDFGKWIAGTVAGERKNYQVRAGTDAQALPGIVRPANFDAINNPFVFVAG
ncbi:MAG: hypothetical protein WC661_18880 [Opitutaceae bacterium]|jgi:hypothetical protein